MAESGVGMYGHEVTDEHHGVTPDGARYFGLLSLRSTYTGYEDTVGLRNSHDKSFPVGIAFGSRVFVCDNTAFIADHVISRLHTIIDGVCDQINLIPPALFEGGFPLLCAHTRRPWRGKARPR
jgi:hypothetical protein